MDSEPITPPFHQVPHPNRVVSKASHYSSLQTRWWRRIHLGFDDQTLEAESDTPNLRGEDNQGIPRCTLCYPRWACAACIRGVADRNGKSRLTRKVAPQTQSARGSRCD